jgi:hypothetical protein
MTELTDDVRVIFALGGLTAAQVYRRMSHGKRSCHGWSSVRLGALQTPTGCATGSSPASDTGANRSR